MLSHVLMLNQDNYNCKINRLQLIVLHCTFCITEWNPSVTELNQLSYPTTVNYRDRSLCHSDEGMMNQPLINKSGLSVLGNIHRHIPFVVIRIR